MFLLLYNHLEIRAFCVTVFNCFGFSHILGKGAVLNWL